MGTRSDHALRPHGGPSGAPAHPSPDLALVTGLPSPAGAVTDGAGSGAEHPRRAHDRLAVLLDPGSFREIGSQRAARQNGARSRPGDGVVTGYGTVHGRRVCVFAQEFGVRGGTMGEAHADKIRRLAAMALSAGVPVVGLYDGGGARIDEGVRALDACGRVFQQFVSASGVVPQISVVLGPCAGAAAYAPALTDFVFMVRGSGTLYLTGPDVVRTVTSEEVDGQSLGGAQVHGTQTGLAAFVHDAEEASLADVRYLLSLLPSHAGEGPQVLATTDDQPRLCPGLRDLVPSDPRHPYDVVSVIEEVVDRDTFIEVHQGWGRSIVCGIGRIGGRVVGVVASQPLVRAGVIDIEASQKAARFVRTCDAFRIPLATLVDVPGFMPGQEQESGAIIRHGAKLLHAYCEATVPRIQVILRKAYGGAYIVMDAPSVGTDLSFAWPTNEVAVMGPRGAVEIVHRRDLALASDPLARRGELEEEYRASYLHPRVAAEAGMVHEVIDPADTRNVLIDALDLLQDKAGARGRKHANHPV